MIIALPELVVKPDPAVIDVRPVTHCSVPAPSLLKYWPLVPVPTANSEIVIESAGKSNLPPLFINVTPLPALI